MAVQLRMQLSEGQAEQLMACRRRMLHELDKMIRNWDYLWADLQVCSYLLQSKVPDSQNGPACLPYVHHKDITGTSHNVTEGNMSPFHMMHVN